MLAQGSQEISEALIHFGVVHHFLYAMGNQKHADAQRQASLALEVQMKLTYEMTHM